MFAHPFIPFRSENCILLGERLETQGGIIFIMSTRDENLAASKMLVAAEIGIIG
jgi:hypothetical protein